MHIALSELDNIVRRRLDPNEVELSDGSAAGIREIPQEVRTKIDLLRSFSLEHFDGEMIVGTNNHPVNHIARSISSLCQHMETYNRKASRIFTVPLKSTYKDVVLKTARELEDFLSFLQFQFKSNFDPNIPVPYTRVDKSQSSFKSRLETIECLRKPLGEYAQLLDLCTLPILCLVKDGGALSFRQLEYYLLMLELLEKMVEKPPPNVNLAMHQMLVSINFNNPDYIHYCIRQLHAKYDSLSNLEQLEKYNWYIKTQRQVEKRPGVAFLPGEPSAFEQLDNYLVHEIAYIQTLIKLDAGIVDGVKVVDNIQPKFRLNMPVEVAAVWLHTWMDTGTIIYNSQEEAIETFCKVFGTLGTDNPSAKSFRSKFYNLTQNSVTSGMDLIHRQREAARAYPK